jgi:hypothetical protein
MPSKARTDRLRGFCQRIQEARNQVITTRIGSAAFHAPGFFMILARPGGATGSSYDLFYQLIYGGLF